MLGKLKTYHFPREISANGGFFHVFSISTSGSWSAYPWVLWIINCRPLPSEVAVAPLVRAVDLRTVSGFGRKASVVLSQLDGMLTDLFSGVTCRYICPQDQPEHGYAYPKKIKCDIFDQLLVTSTVSFSTIAPESFKPMCAGNRLIHESENSHRYTSINYPVEVDDKGCSYRF